MSETQKPVVDFQPYRWGDPDHPAILPETALNALAALGVKQPETPPVPPTDVALPNITLTDDNINALRDIMGNDGIDTSSLNRVSHTRGWSTTDLLTLRSGDGNDAPDAVLYPQTHEHISDVLAYCTNHRIAVVPYAGGTSVVGGLNPERDGYTAVVALDLRHLTGLINIDDISRTATFRTGTRGPVAEKLLNEHGYTLGHFPQSYEGASLGGYAAARSAGQSSAGYGRFDDMVESLTIATPQGTITLGTAPKSASGPDLRHLFLGSEGTLGVITDITVRIRPTPTTRIFEGWRFTDFSAGCAAFRALAQDGPLPTVLRLSDEVETQVNLSDPSKVLTGGPSGCAAIVGYEGTADDVAYRQAAATAILINAGGEPLDDDTGDTWRKGRFRGPYLRDPLLDAGVLVETLETATYWSRIPSVKEAVTTALSETLTAQGTPAIVMCHISHVYETGASLYFTVASAQTSTPLAQWDAAKQAANTAIQQLGATVSHHHGVGRDHRESYAEEIGPLASNVLRAIKDTVDPAGVLNPGILIPTIKR